MKLLFLYVTALCMATVHMYGYCACVCVCVCSVFSYPPQTNNNTLIGSLVRLRDNHLHLAESERVLRAQEKFQELVQLFQTKGQHKKGMPTVVTDLFISALSLPPSPSLL